MTEPVSLRRVLSTKKRSWTWPTILLFATFLSVPAQLEDPGKCASQGEKEKEREKER
jgi:hypothetical protein